MSDANTAATVPGGSLEATEKALPRARPRPRSHALRLMAPAAFTLLFVVVAIVGPALVPYNSVEVKVADRLIPPLHQTRSGEVAWLGTDRLGRDMLAQVLSGARVSLLVGAATVLLAGTVGTLLGIASGYFSGAFDNVVMRLADVQLAFPSILLAILIASVMGQSVTNVIITLAITRWVKFARVARSAALAAKERDFVQAAQALGASHTRILLGHVLPFTMTPLLVIATVEFGLVILAEAGLSFLVLGTPAAMPSWGLTISTGRDYLDSAWWISAIPGLALVFVVVAVGSLGDRLRDLLDPHMRKL